MLDQQQPMDIQKRWGEAVTSGNFDVFDEIISPAIVDHDPAPQQAAGPAGFKAFFTTMRTAFPDLKITAEHAVASGDELAVAYTMEGTHSGPFMGLPATGRRIKARGMQIARFENGKAVERWGSSDELGILKQLGATALPAS